MSDPELSQHNKLFAFLEKEEEQELARRAGQGDQEAADRLVNSHFKYVVKLAKGYRRSGVPMADLVQEGMVGLVQAVRKFNPDKDVRLSTYAMWWIRAAMQDHIVRSWSMVRLSTTSAQKSLFLNLRRMTADLIGGADSLSDEIVSRLAERFETTAADVRNLARRVTHKDKSLNTRLSDESDDSWLDLLPSDVPSPEAALEALSERLHVNELLAKAMASLPDREQFIIRHRYLGEAKKTFAAIGKELNLSKDRVRQLEARALEKLHELLEPVLAGQQIFPK